MIASLLRLLALKPLLTMVIFGIPILVLIVVGLAAVALVKLLVFIVLPIAVGVWLLRKLFRGRREEPVVST